MNKRQRTERLHRRRSASAPRPRVTEATSRASYPKVKRAHIVPKVYQDRFAEDGKVAVHIDGREQHQLRTTAKVGVRSRAYRRVRPSGEEIDDIEASFAEMENTLPGPLERVAAGAPLEGLDKQKLAAFLGAQMVRGSAYRTFYGEFFEREVRPAGETGFTKRARRLHRGDVEAMQSEAQRLLGDSSLQTIAMSEHARRYAAMLGNMTWQLLQFDEPVLAYSDAPVVLWPSAWDHLEPMPKQQFGPLEALEIRAPLSPHVAVVCVWADARDPAPRRMPTRVAAELNAFTISQRDRDWMHSPKAEPPIASGLFLPLSTRAVPGYSIETMRASRRRQLVTRDVTSAPGLLTLTDSYSLYEIE
jgi:Protein of unknown function (DUF4238)